MFKLTYQTQDFHNDMYNLYGLNDSEILSLSKNILIKTFKMDHSIDSIGYGVSQVRKRLNPKYKDLSGKELGVLTKSGDTVNEEYVLHQFIYMGDTYITPLVDDNEIFKYKTIIIECSFILDEDYDHAMKKKHIHWRDLRPFIESHPDNEFILIHFSPRYKQSEIIEFFKQFPSLSNIVLWTQT